MSADWVAAIYGGRALRAELVAQSEPRITPDWQPETLAQRIERVIASVPELCPNCGGSGYIETDGYDDGVMAIDHADCPVCRGLTDPEDE